ncbi:MAG: Response regulator MprA [Chlamydiales bacterium]|nr:Response regulator MprA [Chlamydiales bacterium]MCH9619826.1 Response regulator MprA [Chlamydiales bacterium]MCH9622747.1 Response regulator MprA [Chlamydiales bacterium]
MSKMILTIDDDRDVQEVFSAVLAQAGYSVCQALSGEEGLETLKTNSIDLILLDLHMPGMNGIDTFIKIREMNLEAPVCIISAYVDGYQEELQKLTESGYHFSTLDKPVGMKQLLSKAETLVNGTTT